MPQCRAALSLLGLLVLLLAGCPQPPAAQKAEPAKGADPVAKAEPTAPEPPKPVEPPLPWPECKACLQWLRDNTGDPDSVQVIRWENRVYYGKDDIFGPATVLLRYRAKNQGGAPEVFLRQFYIDIEGDVRSTLVLPIEEKIKPD